MRQRLVFTAWVLVLAVVSQGCRFIESAKNGKNVSVDPPKVAVDAATVSKGDFFDDLEVVGSLSPKYERHVKSEYKGIIERIYVSE